MSNEKFTPGPWAFDDLEMKIKGTGDAEGRTIIANVSPKMDFSRGMNTQCANAALIAAAPAMYKALAALEYRLKHQVENYQSVCQIDDNEAESILKILAAARGEPTE
jgi:hypothetical protein